MLRAAATAVKPEGTLPAMFAPAATEVLYAMVRALGRLPGPVRTVLAGASARLWSAFGLREYKVARRNMVLIQPEATPDECQLAVREVLRGTAVNLLDTLAVWGRGRAWSLDRIVEREGEEMFLAALRSPRGLIVAAPHYGNWELLNRYLASRSEIAIVYRPPDSAVADVFLRRVRRDPNIVQVRAEAAGVRQLFRVLKAGGTVGILPDQQPKSGDGVFAPFFGKSALTMTLVQRLAQRTGALVLFAFAERRPDGDYRLCFRPADPAVADSDPVPAAAALNAGVEAIARRDFRQYQWTYKRYTIRPPESGEGNPYWPECYSRRALRRARRAAPLE